ncbi:hypothetical protein MTO96_013750 [Rhipicephalus appendiculatus]
MQWNACGQGKQKPSERTESRSSHVMGWALTVLSTGDATRKMPGESAASASAGTENRMFDSHSAWRRGRALHVQEVSAGRFRAVIHSVQPRSAFWCTRACRQMRCVRLRRTSDS